MKEAVMFYLGLDMHKKTSYVTLMDQAGAAQTADRRRARTPARAHGRHGFGGKPEHAGARRRIGFRATHVQRGPATGADDARAVATCAR